MKETDLFGAKFNKKGNAILDTMTVMIFLVVFGMVTVFGYQAFSELNTDIQADLTHTEATSTSQGLFDKYATLFDNLFVFAYILLILFLLVSVFTIDTHPIFFIISITLLIGVFIVAILLANTFDDVMNDSTISVFANEFTYMSWVMGHLLEVSIGIAFLVSIALFIKFRGT